MRPSPNGNTEAIKHWANNAPESDLLAALNEANAQQWLQWHTPHSRETLFHFAARYHYPHVLARMVELGFDPATLDESGDNALHYALIYAGRDPQNENPTIAFLLECGLAGRACNETQSIPVAQLIIERKWKTPPGYLHWLQVAAKNGMDLVEQVSEDMVFTPLETLMYRALGQGDRVPYDEAMAAMCDLGLYPLQQLRWAYQVVLDHVEEDNPGAQLKPIARVQALFDHAALAKHTPHASSMRAPRL